MKMTMINLINCLATIKDQVAHNFLKLNEEKPVLWVLRTSLASVSSWSSGIEG